MRRTISMVSAGFALVLASTMAVTAQATTPSDPSDPTGVSLTRVEGTTAGGRAITVNRLSAFALPSGNIFCIMNGKTGAHSPDRVWCEISKKTYPSSRPATCVGDEKDTWYDQVVQLHGTKKAQFACFHSESTAAYSVIKDSIFKQSGGWYNAKKDTTVTTGLGVNAALRYGSTMTWGDVTCAVSTKGVTCRNAKTKHGFAQSRAAVRFW